MLIILTLYVVLVGLLFSKLKLVRWGWFTGSVAVCGSCRRHRPVATDDRRDEAAENDGPADRGFAASFLLNTSARPTAWLG